MARLTIEVTPDPLADLLGEVAPGPRVLRQISNLSFAVKRSGFRA